MIRVELNVMPLGDKNSKTMTTIENSNKLI